MKTPVEISRGFLFCLFFSIFFLISGCATLSSALDPRITADKIARESLFSKEFIKTDFFTLLSYSSLKNPGQLLTVYIEGDGRAWLSKNCLSDDPTPVHPLVLRLAAMDLTPNVAYLARPCQYISDEHCDSVYWSDKRFAEEVIASMNQAIDRLKHEAKAQTIRLVGYSGGGAIAVLVTARRHDVASLCTIAGNLDHKALNEFHHVTPLVGSLNPIDFAAAISRVPQVHFVGGKDKIVPAFIAKRFVARAQNPLSLKIIEIHNASHGSGWDRAWMEYCGKSSDEDLINEHK